MIVSTRNLYVALDRQTGCLVEGKNSRSSLSLELFEGDTQTIKVFLVEADSDFVGSKQLGQKESLTIVVTQSDSLSTSTIPILALCNTFDEAMDSDGHIYYEGELSLNTEEILTALGEGNSSISCTIEVVILDSLFGKQFTMQSSMVINRSALPSSDADSIGTPSVNIGSYETVNELCREIVDGRILQLKDGAPAEFDTLFELAESAMKAESLRAEVGTFQDYLDGKALADSGLTITQLGAIASDGASASVEL